ncbi:Glycosyl hydrolases family 35 [Bryocella elongata]|uniref:Beta-galactosidase n=1 Tax=Bryocella elongata TaxID=863522 RepID=A0A1H5UYF8_9BACT|nr:beta-galactosidase [Bryocella elongata]SEF80119.1 Glycosyl hydrolases family 35 [Bryocella elongata]
MISQRPSLPLHLVAAIVAALLAATAHASAQNIVTIDATAPQRTPQPVAAHLGADRSPSGETIGVNSEYLTRNGKPWLPVMGEFHYSRYPRGQWQTELEKMKAAGVGIVSTYVIWIHHEETEGSFDWTGQRDLRAFAELCAREGLYLYPRIGPWAHAEARNGGLPDWVLTNSPVRQNDPVYLREVAAFYQQIGEQLHGLMWKDGGPVIGIQLENEYREHGPGKGAEHLHTLKKLALDAGLDVPLYTVTGWDGAVIPLDAALPVFGGYPDAPWDGSPKQLPAPDVYAFRFENRAAGSMGAIGGSGQGAASAYAGTPFLTAEIGGGVEDTYFRRPALNADDVAAVAPVMLGSGANLLGFYMFHGGRNPDGGPITLQESQRTGYPTDVPVKGYDFQAPLGEFGQERESLNKLKLVNYFLEDFGGELAPMQVHAPAATPASPADLSMPRVAARTAGDAGFLFVNNHIRNATSRRYGGFQVRLKLPEGELRVPATPIDLKPGVYGIWPVNLRLGEATLRYSTAQLFQRIHRAGRTYTYFFAIPGVEPEFLFVAGTKLPAGDRNIRIQPTAQGLIVRPQLGATKTLDLPGAETIVLLTEPEAEEIWRGDAPGLLVQSKAAAFSHGKRWTLEQTGDPHFGFRIFDAEAKVTSHDAHVSRGPANGLFRSWSASLPAIDLPVRLTMSKPAGPIPPYTMGKSFPWRKQPVPLAPDAPDFERAAAWTISLPAIPLRPELAGALLRVRYQGDAARLYAGNQLLDDNFWNGAPWEIGVTQTGVETAVPSTLQLRILPLPRSHPMFLEGTVAPRFRDGKALELDSVALTPVYQFSFTLSDDR